MIAMKLASAAPPGRGACSVILLGGRPYADVQATYGAATVNEIARHHADVAVLSPVGLTAEQGATSYEHHEAAVAEAMVRQAKRL